jgi:periplasmic protein TonB
MAAVFLLSWCSMPSSLQSPDRARVRLALALAASALVHGWLATGVVFEAFAPPASSPATVLSAWLEPAAAVRLPDPDVHEQAAVPSPVPVQAAFAPNSAVPQHKARDAGATSAPASTQTREAPVPPPTADSTYYSARELDVYPAPLSPLTFGYPERAEREHVSGTVSFMVLIDAAGMIDSIKLIAAEPPGYFEDAARAAFAAARFSPARRNGQAVRSRVQISVDYNPATLLNGRR